MAGLFFGNRDITVSISAAQAYSFSYLNKSLIITDEAEIPFSKLSGKGAVTELEAILTGLGVEAPKLTEALTKFITQADNSGNSVLPEYVYVIGEAEPDIAASTSLLEAAIESVVDSNDFYCLIPVFESVSFNTWFAGWGNTNKRIMMPFTKTKGKEVTDVEKSVRICGIYDPEEEGKNAAWAGRVVSMSSLVAWKWKFLTGCNTDLLTGAEVSTLEKAGWNGYRKVRSSGETTGSRTFSNTQETPDFIDTIVKRDNIIYNVANALSAMFKKNEIVPMGDSGRQLVKQAIGAALNASGSYGLISQFEDKTYQYSITVPEITADMRSARELTDVEFTYVPKYAMEKITVDGQELLEWVS